MGIFYGELSYESTATVEETDRDTIVDQAQTKAAQPPAYQPQAQQTRPANNNNNTTSNSNSNSTNNHFVSSQDVWGGTATALPAPILDTGFGAFGGSTAGQGQKTRLEDDPFQNIWK